MTVNPNINNIQCSIIAIVVIIIVIRNFIPYKRTSTWNSKVCERI